MNWTDKLSSSVMGEPDLKTKVCFDCERDVASGTAASLSSWKHAKPLAEVGNVK